MLCRGKGTNECTKCWELSYSFPWNVFSVLHWPGAAVSQLVSRTLTEVFWSIYCCQFSGRRWACSFLVCLFFYIISLEWILLSHDYHILPLVFSPSRTTLFSYHSFLHLLAIFWPLLYLFTFKSNFVFILLFFPVHSNSH